MALTGKQTRHLRSLGHHLDPVVQIGKNGITEALVAQLAEAIAHHELIKVKVLPECPLDRGEAGEEAARALDAELVQTLGRTLLFWKRNPQKPKVELPNARGELRPAARKEASKGKLPPSRVRPASEPDAEEPRPWRNAPGEGTARRTSPRPRPAGESRARRTDGKPAATARRTDGKPAATARRTDGKAPAKRTAGEEWTRRPGGKGPAKRSAPPSAAEERRNRRAPEPVKAPPRDQSARSDAGEGRPTSRSRPAIRRPGR
jgi:RNA-binding protein